MSWRTIRQRTSVFRSMRRARKKATRSTRNYFAAKRAAAVLQRVMKG